MAPDEQKKAKENAALAVAAAEAAFRLGLGMGVFEAASSLPQELLGLLKGSLPHDLADAWTPRALQALWRHRRADLVPLIRERLDAKVTGPEKPSGVSGHAVEDQGSVRPERSGASGVRAPILSEHSTTIVIKEEDLSQMLREVELGDLRVPQAYDHSPVEYIDGRGQRDPELSAGLAGEIEARVRHEMARLCGELKEELRGHLTRMMGSAERLDDEEPPLPPRKGRKMLGSKGHISVRVDMRLVQLFQDECRKHDDNASRAMDVILWRYFGKPALSFEKKKAR